MAALGQMKVEDTAALPRVTMRCWGDFALVDCATAEDLKLRGRKTRALLAYLAFHPGKTISRERLTGLLWGDRGEDQARASLRQAILELRPLATEQSEVVTIERNHLCVQPGSIETDIEQMRRAVHNGDYARLVDLLPEPDERMFANLDGLDEAFDDWLAIERSRQADALITLTADASAAALSQGQMRAARALHARLREFDPAVASLPIIAPFTRNRTVPNSESAGDARVVTHWRARPTTVLALLLALLAVVAATIWLLQPKARVIPPTIAVLPFEGVTRDNVAFANGLSEEITSQLARQQGFQVAGRTSASQFRSRATDLRRLGRKLHVSYILEGSVRSAGGLVRVNVSLTKTSDGLQVWAETFDGTLDDILGIQYRIATNVANALKQQLVSAGPQTGSLATTGQVYSLYLTARGLLRERTVEATRQARAHLERAVALDPSFAPAWSSLAQAEYPGGDSTQASVLTLRAIGHAQRALTLAPDLAEAHAVLGMIYGFDDPKGRQHIERAVQLDPNNAEYQYWLGNVQGDRSNFAITLAAYRRAFALDPLWTRPQEYLVKTAWSMGEREEALRVVRQIDSDGTATQRHVIRATLAQAQGNLSEAASELRLAASVSIDPGRKSDAEWRRAMVLEELGLFEQSYAIRRKSCGEKLPPAMSDPYITIRLGKLPSLPELQARNRNAHYSFRDLGYVGRSAKMMINAGRAREVVAIYEHGGLLQISPTTTTVTSEFLEMGPVIAAALRAVGRTKEAISLLARLDRELAFAQKRSGGAVPGWFLAMAAQTWAVMGRDEQAIRALDRALASGWHYVRDLDDPSLPDFGDEPAFRSLRGNKPFEVIRARINSTLAHERNETLSVGAA